MREIKFRGLGVDGHWRYGELNPQGEYHINLATFFANVHAGAIRPETVGQYIGLPDKNGKEIYEGDIVRLDGNAFVNHEVFWYEPTYQYLLRSTSPIHQTHFLGIAKDSKTIGNIWENKELLKAGR